MSRFLLKFITIFITLFSFIFSANIGDLIVNSAKVNYTINGVEKNSTTNSVTVDINATDATIEFLQFSKDSNSSEMLRDTKYKKADNSYATLPDAKLPNGDTIAPPKEIGVVNTNNYLNNDLILIRVTDLDQNINSDKLDEISIEIKDPNTGDIESLILKETSLNSGVFVGYIQAVSKSATRSDGELSVEPNDKISAIYIDNGQNKEIVADANIDIVNSDAKINFLKYDKDSKYKKSIESSRCKSGNKWIDIEDINIPEKDTLKTPQELPLSDTLKYYNRDFVAIKVEDSDQNIHSDKIDYVEVVVKDPKTKDSVTLQLAESGVNSGIFIGFTHTVTTNLDSNDCKLSVNPNDKIYVYYQDDNNTKTLSDSALIVTQKTEAKIDFLKYSDSNIGDNNLTFNIGITRCKGKDGVYRDIKRVDIPNGESIEAPFSSTLKDTKYYYEKDLVLIKVEDYDQNIHDDKIDSVEIEVYDPSTKDTITLELKETTEDSGIFVGYTHTTDSKDSSSCKLSVNSGDIIYTKYFDKSHNKYRIDSAKIKAMPYSLMVTKKSLKDEVAIGEFVKYVIKVKNLRDISLKNINLFDKLPDGLKYIDGTFKDSNKTLKIELSKSGKVINYLIKDIKRGESLEYSYIAVVSSNAKDEEINRVWAKGNSGIFSNLAAHKIKIKRELFSNRGFIIGKVYNRSGDCNKTGSIKEPKLCGVEGVKLYMEDGRYTITDEDGRYHFVDVRAGNHIVQIDKLSIKDRYKVSLCNNNTRFASRGSSQFVNILNSELRRVDFCLKPLPHSTFKSDLKLDLVKKDATHLILNISIESSKKLLEPEVYIALPDGISYVKGSVKDGEEPVLQKGILITPMDKKNKSLMLEVNLNYPIDDAIEAMLYYDTKIAQDQHTQKVVLPINVEKSGFKIAKSSANTTIIKHEQKDKSGDFGWKRATKEATMPEWSSQELDKYGSKPQIIWPPRGWVPSIPSTKIAVIYGKNQKIELKLNGNKVNPLNYQKLFYNSDRSVRAIYYKGVDLREGKNVITATVKDKNGAVVANLSREIWVESGLPLRVEYMPEFSYLRADGKHTPIIAVKFIAKSGHPIRGGMVGSYSVDGGYEPQVKQNGKGSFTIDSDGIAYIKLKPTTKAGVAKLKFALLDNREQIIDVRLKPHFRDWIVVALAEGGIGYNTISSNMEPANSSKLTIDGRVALFAKGKIKGKYLLTLAYDNKKDKRELFDKIDPNRYYIIYGDRSTQKSEAASTSKLYLKLESDTFFAMYGDFNTNFDNSEFLNYNQAFTGFNAEIRKRGFRVDTFIAKSKNIHFKEEIRADGTAGYYYLKSKNIVKNSESVTIETRDRLHKDIVLKEEKLSRYSDYDIDYDKGRLFFKEPIFSTDKSRNPKYIVVEYQLNAGDKSYYTYGANIEYKSKRVESNLRYIKENGDIKSGELFGANIKYNLNNKTSLYAEVTKSKNRVGAKEYSANAKYFNIEYKDSNSTVTAWYRQKDKNFGIDNLEPNSGSLKSYGIKATHKLTKRVDATLELNRVIDTNSSDGAVTTLGGELEYKDSNNSATIGFRNVKAKDSVNQVTLSYSKKMLDNNLSIGISHEQNLGSSVSSSYPSSTTLNMNYKVDKNSTIFGTITRSKDRGELSWQSQIGVDYKPWRDGSISLKRVTQSGGDIDSIYNSLSLRQKVIFGRYLSATFGYEKGIYEDESSKNFDAANIALDYSDSNKSLHMAVGGKTSSINKKLNMDMSASVKNSKSTAFAFNASSYTSWDENSKSRSSKANLSYVYRPQNSKVVVLDKLEFKEEYSKSNSAKSQTLKFINNLHLNYKINSRWELGLQYGLKHTIDTIDEQTYRSWVDLFGVFAQYDVNEKFSIGGQFALLHLYSANNFSYSAGVFATKEIWENAELILGYNLNGFRDSDFNLQNNYSSRVYIQFRIKFDQSDIKDFLDGVSK